ncbi:MAG: GNAT family N-acetyltransferase [Christensenellaceae bacterium]|nr:GNAT family N-acetyltransferase [Christensenellaceae bacterium]
MKLIPVESEDRILETEKLAAEIWNEAYGKLLGQAQVDYMLEKFQSAPAMRRQMQEEGYMYRLIYSNDKPKGYMAWKLEPEKLFLSKLYLLASARGLGLAAEAFAFLEEEGRRQGKKAMYLTVNRGNDRAVAAYKKNGFVTVRTQVADIGGGFVMDDFIMEKAL